MSRLQINTKCIILLSLRFIYLNMFKINGYIFYELQFMPYSNLEFNQLNVNINHEMNNITYILN